MSSYTVLGIPERVAALVRETMTAPRCGHPAHVEAALGGAPCRVCLRGFEEGVERRILFTYDPFAETRQPPLPGPVFFHERPCESFPADTGFPAALCGQGLTWTAYDAERRPLLEQRTDPEADVDLVAERLTAPRDVHVVHVRNTANGCFLCRLVPTRVA